MTSGSAPHIAIVTPRYFPDSGGVETHVHETASRLAAAGWRLTILTTDRTGSRPPRESRQGFEILRFRAYPSGTDLYVAPTLYQHLTSSRYDLIHLQGIHTFVPMVAMHAARRIGTPYVVSFHSGGHSSVLRRAIRGIQWRALRSGLRHADRLIAVCEYEIEQFGQAVHLSPQAFTLIRNGAELRTAVQVDPAVRTHEVLSIGRLERYKGHDRAIAAFPYLRAAVPDATLTIVGAGPDEPRLRRLAESADREGRIEIISYGADERDHLGDRVARAGAVTLLSDYEAHPVAVMEALSLRRPVLVARTSGLSELADAGLVTGISRDATPAQIGRALARLLLAEQPPAPVQLPTWDGCATALGAVYDSVLAERTRHDAPPVLRVVS